METTNVQIVGRDSSGSFSAADIQKIDKSFFNSSVTLAGFNIYQIQPKIKTFIYNAYAESVNDSLLTASGNNVNYSTYNWGLGSALKKTYSIYSSDFARRAYYDYIDQSGNEKSSFMDVSANLNTFFKEGNIACINNFRVTPNVNGNAVYFTIATSVDIAKISYNGYYNAAIMCPNNAIMRIENMTVYTNQRNTFTIYKNDPNGLRSAQAMYGLTGTNNMTTNSVGSLAGYYYPGETLTMSNTAGGNNTGNVYVYARVMIKYF